MGAHWKDMSRRPHSAPTLEADYLPRRTGQSTGPGTGGQANREGLGGWAGGWPSVRTLAVREGRYRRRRCNSWCSRQVGGQGLDWVGGGHD